MERNLEDIYLGLLESACLRVKAGKRKVDGCVRDGPRCSDMLIQPRLDFLYESVNFLFFSSQVTGLFITHRVIVLAIAMSLLDFNRCLYVAI